MVETGLEARISLYFKVGRKDENSERANWARDDLGELEHE